MKTKIFFVILICGMLLSGCSVASEEDSGIHADKGSYYFTSISEYKEHIKTANIPENYITFDAVSCLGNFGSYSSNMGVVRSYRYSIDDPNGVMVGISIRHKPHYSWETEIKNAVLFPNNLEDMRFITGLTDPACYIRHGLTYIYVGGEKAGSLVCVVWIEDSIEYVISMASVLADYPTGRRETIVSRLLSLDETVSKAAFTELKAHMRANS